MIGKRIKEQRTKKGLSQEELGKRFSITQHPGSTTRGRVDGLIGVSKAKVAFAC